MIYRITGGYIRFEKDAAVLSTVFTRLSLPTDGDGNSTVAHI